MTRSRRPAGACERAPSDRAIELRGPVPISGADGRFEAIEAPGKTRVHVEAKGRYAPSPEITVAPGATVDAGRIAITARPPEQ